MKKTAIFSIALLSLVILSSSTLPSRWDMLGSRKINKSYDRDQVYVTHVEGTFNALKIKVLHKPVTLYDVKVHYGNGSVEDLSSRVYIPAGGESRVVDLQGGNRVIKKVVFRYETRSVRGKRAEILLFGRH